MERTKEQEKEIISRIKQFMKDNNLTQKSLEKEIGIRQNHISMYLTGSIPMGETFLYALIYKYLINPRWLEFGEEPVYLSPNVTNIDNTNGIIAGNNISGDNNNVKVEIPIEALRTLNNQSETLRSQQETIFELVKKIK